ncbi:Xaa-Pro peptidase family protein [Jannaschia sp. LMIT008]|uniref:Xaa-Pro peptidase family protein n=1 Tax=Jannaschia maritima TaxID=3032585 RepID=UPI0028121DBE|nr:Xaa-Pro peptidase family protein [Jannaschia sp. LMIT008]
MTEARRAAVAQAARAVGADWMLLTAPDSLAYAGHVAGIEAGPSPFDGGPSAALIGPDGAFHVACNELEVPIAEAAGARAHGYEALGFADLRPLHVKYAEAARAMLDAARPSGRVAVEPATLPASLAALLDGRVDSVDGARALAERRAVKLPDEVDRLRRAAHCTAEGQNAVGRALRTGATELDAWRDVRLAMERFAGTRTPVGGDFVSGVARTAAIGGPATTRVLEPGDPVIADLAPRVDGYWGDSATTTILGEPSDALRRMYAHTHAIWRRVLDTLRPGITAHDFDAPLRAMVAEGGYANPVHMGHGIGASIHEWPRLVPGEDAVLKPGMVLMVEPGCYHPDIGGVRLEQMFLLTDDGHEILSPFDIAPEPPVV